MSAFDPGCVKTHTSAKCRKNNSSRKHHTSRRQGDLTLRCAIASRCFYVYGECWSFHTAKTQSGHERVAFAAMHGPTLLYSACDPWPWGTPHEAARVHHLAQQCGGVAARGARAAAQGNASHWHVDLGRRESSAMARSRGCISPPTANARLDRRAKHGDRLSLGAGYQTNPELCGRARVAGSRRAVYYDHHVGADDA